MTAPRSGFFTDLARLYPDLDTGFLAGIADEFEQVQVAGGATLVRYGEPSDALYVLMSGRLVATRQDENGGMVRVGEIGRGEMIGEMSLLSGGTRTATVTALRDSHLLRISNHTFLEFMQRHPSVTRQFIQILTSRLMKRAPLSHEKLSTLALVSAGPAERVAGFGRALEAALRTLVSVQRIDRALIEARFPGVLARAERAERNDDRSGSGGDVGGAGSESSDHISAWLNDQERLHDMLLYVCDPHPTAWTRLCLRQADRVLVVADGGCPAATPDAVEQLLQAGDVAQLRGSELVLLHPAGCERPVQTARWLASRQVRRHHHLRDGDSAALARLCRHLIGRSIGLALGGGGAKTFAGVGVLRALAQAGIPVDVIGGTSMGAVIGALAAQGREPAAIQAALHQMLKLKPFSGLTLPLVSLLSGKRLAQAMQTLFGATDIEDLWQRYFCVVCNLTDGSVKPVQRGPLQRWVGASNAVPGVMPPLIDGGALYVDGGLLNNVPADLMSQLNAGPVIAVNVSSDTTLQAGSGAAPPRLGRLLVRAMLLASSNHAAAMKNYSSLYLTPPLAGVDVSDWHALDQLVETGYTYASKALETWHRDLPLK